MLELINNLEKTLTEDSQVILASIIQSSGSTPRASGSRMLIRQNKEIFGTIGGGLVEAMTQKTAAKMFENNSSEIIIADFDLSNTLAANADMICGGHAVVLLEKISKKDSILNEFSTIKNELQNGCAPVLFTTLSEDKKKIVERFVVTEDHNKFKSELPAELISQLNKKAHSKEGICCVTHQGLNVLVESFTPAPTLFIFGAGHVSRPTAALAKSVNFRTVVLDDRADFANKDRFKDADEIIVLDKFKGAMDKIKVNKNSYILIVTRGHLHDKRVLGEALETNARYVGMIGSSKKRNAIYSALLEEGTTQDQIDRCFCPVGLEINAQTPEEIAVSIVAELIQQRASK